MFERRLAIAGIIGGTLLTSQTALQPFVSPKVAWVVVCAIAGLGYLVWDTITNRSLRLPTGAPAITLGLFLVAGAVSVVVSSSTGRSILGQPQRGSGLLLYAAAAVVLVVVARAFTNQSLRPLALTVLGVVAAAGAYALLQRVGLDPFDWESALGDRAMISTLGNTNFTSGFLAIGVPLAAALALDGRHPARFRSGAAAVGVVLLVTILLTRSSQGLIASVGGLVVTGGMVTLRGVERVDRRVIAGAGILAALAAGVLALGLAARGPLAIVGDVGVEQRRSYWSTAAEIVADEPLLGVGFDMYADHFREARPLEDATTPDAIVNVADEPHSVPLGMFVSGGLVLGLAYLAFVVSVALLVLRTWRTTAEPVVFAGLAGAWVGYQAQALVSIDVPPLVILHFALAGGLLAASGAVRVVWPRTVDEPSKARRTRREARAQEVRSRNVAIGVAAVCLVLVWRGTLPVRADFAAGSALRDGRSVSSEEEVEAVMRRAVSATKLAPWESLYWNVLGDAFVSSRAPAIAAVQYAKAIDREPRSFTNVVSAARALAQTGDRPHAGRYYERALELEPHAPALKFEVAQHYLDVGLVDRARELYEEGAAVDDSSGRSLYVLSRLTAIDGDEEGALELVQRALEVEPFLEPARSFLQQLEAEQLAEAPADGDQPATDS